MGDEDWKRLAEKGTLGKSAIIQYTPTTSLGVGQDSPTNMLELPGDDKLAMQVQLVLSPPQLLAGPNVPTILQSQVQNIGSTQNNGQLMAAENIGFVEFANPIVIIDFGIGGVQNTVECDILNGLILNLSTSFLRVRARVESPGATTASLFYRLAAYVGPGRPKDNNAQRTVFCGNVLGDGLQSAVFAIPKFAKSVRLVGATSLGDTFVGRIRFQRDLAAASILRSGEFLASANNPGPFPIPNGSYYFSVINQTGAALIPAPVAVFDLAV